MFQTAFTLTFTQFARLFSLPERLQRSPIRNMALEALRQRNTALDALFYDVKSIRPEEAFYISGALAAEGSIMIVPPSGGTAIVLCETVEEFALRGGQEVHTLTVAGIGGSALGAAAFARNVADATGAPVAVVVSGYGLADIITETVGGHFLFGHMKGLRPMFQLLDDFAGRPKLGAADKDDAGAGTRTSLDTRTVSALLADPRLSFRLLAGHSKGNLVIAAALHDLGKQDEARLRELATAMKIVTFGARIAMPPVFSDVIDVIGDWDWFGEMNSRPFIATDHHVRHAGHSTNTELPGHLAVTPLLRDILAAGPMPEKPEDRPALHLVSDAEPPADALVAATTPPPPQRTVRRPATAKRTSIKKVKQALSEARLPDVSAIEPPPSGGSQPSKPH
ncbi:MAG: hypothetical protein KGI75_03970 [Rhizobiaceae bacterium]|nr:hypothetical protein [Rhizobiaceae bacterium]